MRSSFHMPPRKFAIPLDLDSFCTSSTLLSISSLEAVSFSSICNSFLMDTRSSRFSLICRCNPRTLFLSLRMIFFSSALKSLSLMTSSLFCPSSCGGSSFSFFSSLGWLSAVLLLSFPSSSLAVLSSASSSLSSSSLSSTSPSSWSPPSSSSSSLSTSPSSSSSSSSSLFASAPFARLFCCCFWCFCCCVAATAKAEAFEAAGGTEPEAAAPSSSASSTSSPSASPIRRCLRWRCACVWPLSA
mmetsp:Transcript_18031/g.38533  ORF Transcript_18031/g.38533 Transcript_18031/m.38533 type:complete len:243 (-) Transcript_18031:478-1206(-)